MKDLQKEELEKKVKKQIDENLVNALLSDEDDIIKKYFKWSRKADEFYQNEIDKSSKFIKSVDLGKFMTTIQVRDNGAFIWEGLDKENPLDDLRDRYKEEPKYILEVFLNHCDHFDDYFTENMCEQLCNYYKKINTYDDEKNYYEEIEEMDYNDIYKSKAFDKLYKDYFYIYREGQEIREFINDKLKSLEKKEEIER